jgi:hypothetical protein
LISAAADTPAGFTACHSEGSRLLACFIVQPTMERKMQKVIEGKYAVKALKTLQKARVDKIGNKAVVGFQIPIMKLSTIFDAGMSAANNGASDDEIFEAMQKQAAAVSLA